ncbi:GNAT family N-acetyltransferase [Pseudoalteromonas luteoviolacea]|uniref:GNAT family N-acetyltransferase n=1 Tax=Pseudoalteromonas luteoviolacea TaxID=43657 RepID=UPI001154F626|nr:GNAT family N-acetyltransferase [Pseudoalteromonas luteoviolacea]TQF70260.1 GNAT family N-acetyltransferase [Pseudoalteromonas luteoviolacea]
MELSRMNGEVTIRKAKKEEIHWVNEQYQRIGFKLSSLESDLIVIAMIDGQKIGVGRVQTISEFHAELGGMYVNPDFRGAGVAAKLVAFLVENASQFKHVYCLPFAHLAKFYQKFGFKQVIEREGVPDLILSKHHWCNDIYDHETLLFVKYNSKTEY